MISLQDAIAIVQQSISPMESEAVPLGQANGRILSAPVVAMRTQPPFNASAMDGYAVRSADLADGIQNFELAGESAAGHRAPTALEAAQAMRISTGAPLPEGADQVVIQENSQRQGGHVRLEDTARPGANVRKAGIDFAEGDRLIAAGQRITPDAIALMASAGVEVVSVIARPRIGIVSTGDELVEMGEEAGPDQIINSIAPALVAHVAGWGGEPVYLGIARDNRENTEARLALARDFDILVTIGGASVGDHDHLRPAFETLGGQFRFEKIAVKPGKPTWFGCLGDTWCIGLPGNPVSALVMARLILRTAIQACLGQAHELVFQTAAAGTELAANGSRETFVRAVEDRRTGRVRPLDNQDSSAQSALASSTCLIRRPANAPPLAAGERVEILRLD
ncbi:gephyrin-like molybdotransferase Glp [Hyphobacterium sp. HN65]|uniref:Molybdopterin molybdenumtransferase n=1 Tax=Hyphobacterium lacteum TaxID=3116575 RepID=A0ABU7LP75_9PROT|nr:gephyrin-like molybdotransferase Glp [Hyphobacterium sp. HN65]MEE2525731.1 gephyrin-like molybdotransferase Glp [Hyphobacterium sp. HN65]